MTDAQIEQEIRAKGLTAPRITPDDIEANIASEHYFTAADGYCGEKVTTAVFQSLPDAEKIVVPPEELEVLTFCVLILRNGYTVSGESACASLDNFDAEIGRKIARENAVNKVWPLMGYELKQRLHQAAE